MNLCGRLELTWTGKEERTIVEPRLLIEDKSKSYGNQSEKNMIVHGDNLIALKALEKEFLGKIKCIYIDPPYNTGAAFSHYNDNLEHSIWLSLMKSRLEILYKLLSNDGSIWISVDDDEGHYLKVLCDEIFGRSNFISTVIWEKKFSPQNDAKWLSDCHDFILVYAKKKELWKPNLLPRTDDMNNRYKNLDNDPRGPWTSGDCLRKDVQQSGLYEVVTPSGRVCVPPTGRSWRFSKETFDKLILDNRIWFGQDGNNVPRIKRFLSDVKQGITAMTIWKNSEVGHNQEATQEVRIFNNDNPFDTPKPERLIERILTLATNEGDLVLDSFLGSGTTCAVAHKMNRRWIGIELGNHAYTHCKIRLDMVIDGEQGGISKSVNWHGGGGYKFYELSEPLFIKHHILGIYQVNPIFDSETLQRYICHIEGYVHENKGLIHGHSTEKHYIHITKEFVNGEIIQQLMNLIDDNESVSIYALKYQSDLRLPENIEIIDIMKKVLPKCINVKE